MKIKIFANRLTWTAVDGTDTRITRINVEADNGATGCLIYYHPNYAPKFYATNKHANSTQILAGEKCASEINLARINKTASPFDIYHVLTEAGWNTITPA